MKTIVVYQSGTGFTARYAKWIAERLKCKVSELKKVTAEQLKQYDRVIYGGYIQAGIIVGLDKVKAMNLKALVIYGVGLAVRCPEVENKIKEANQLKDEPFFYFQGGMDLKRLGFLKRQMLNIVKKMASKKKEKTIEDINMINMLGVQSDYTDIRFIEGLIQYCRA